MDRELLEELNEMIDNGCSMAEVFEYIEEHPELTKQKIEYIRQIQRAISKKKVN